MAWAQIEISRGVSATFIMPTRDLNHWRGSSIKVTAAIGVPQICVASRVRSSKADSGGVSKMS